MFSDKAESYPLLLHQLEAASDDPIVGVVVETVPELLAVGRGCRLGPVIRRGVITRRNVGYITF